jgi:hypothetical protein
VGGGVSSDGGGGRGWCGYDRAVLDLIVVVVVLMYTYTGVNAKLVKSKLSLSGTLYCTKTMNEVLPLQKNRKRTRRISLDVL